MKLVFDEIKSPGFFQQHWQFACEICMDNREIKIIPKKKFMNIGFSVFGHFKWLLQIRLCIATKRYSTIIFSSMTAMLQQNKK